MWRSSSAATAPRASISSASAVSFAPRKPRQCCTSWSRAIPARSGRPGSDGRVQEPRTKNHEPSKAESVLGSWFLVLKGLIMSFKTNDFKKTTRTTDGERVLYPYQIKDDRFTASIGYAIAYYERMVGRRRGEFEAETLLEFFGDP